MKLERLVLKNFGSLGSRTFDFKGKSAVIYGPNEAGKTTFIDAVTAAMFGAPRGNTIFGKKYSARYETGALAEALLRTDDGAQRTCTQDNPLEPDPEFPPELFRTLLTVRAGEMRIAHEERNFVEAFTSRVLGGGKVNLGRGMNDIRKIYSPDRRSRWYTLLTDSQDALNLLRTKIYKTGDIESSMRAKNELTALLAQHGAERDSLAQRKALLDGEYALAALEELKRLQAELLTTEKDIENLKDINRNTSEYYRSLNAEVNALREQTQASSARIAEIEKNIADQTGVKAALEAVVQNMPAQDLRENAAAALENFRARQAVSAALGKGGNHATAGFAGMGSALVVIAGATILRWPWYVGWLTGIAVGAGVYLAVRNMAVFSRAVTSARQELEAARNEYYAALEKLGGAWAGGSPEETAARFERAEHDSQRTSGKLETVRALLLDQDRRLAAEKAELAQADTTYRQFSDKLRTGLTALGADNIEALNAKVEKLEYLFCTRDDLVRRICREVGATGKEVKAPLEQKIQELQRALPPDLPEMPPRPLRAIELDHKRAEKELQAITAQIEQDHKNLAETTDKLARLEGEVGMPAAEVFARENTLEYEVRDIISWRDAAESAHGILSEISKANEDMVRNCVENASPVFSALSGGSYSGLELRGQNPFEENGITVRHAELGPHGLDWMSSGAQDILWLAVRIIFASTGYTRPAFMILDEPFHSLDAKRTANALRALSEGPLANWQFIILTKDPLTASLAQEHKFERINLLAPVEELS